MNKLAVAGGYTIFQSLNNLLTLKMLKISFLTNGYSFIISNLLVTLSTVSNWTGSIEFSLKNAVTMSINLLYTSSWVDFDGGRSLSIHK